ncbi:hypothetical protein [Rhodovulum kholense]|uniref:Uncharacterized protein n=1 Tax=Rhodovulum kholense TaxID=453584 RepID=A0A8E2VJG7_9RHOB|nr:hypothetical protein [Rhodovulum kholense]PTW48342.1 hypothetical protein C8N38_10894 [Rhodovulum kholense]
MWIQARHRATGAATEVGISTLPQTETLSIGGRTRTYYGAGTMV